MTEAKRATKGRGWKALPVFVVQGFRCEPWRRGDLTVLSSLDGMEAPDGSKDVLPTWLVSVSKRGRAMVPDADLARVRQDFDMVDAEEDNHTDGISRGLFMCVDPARRVACECKVTERVIVRPDGYRYSVPK